LNARSGYSAVANQADCIFFENCGADPGGVIIEQPWIGDDAIPTAKFTAIAWGFEFPSVDALFADSAVNENWRKFPQTEPASSG
jgi:hypothetical protein